MDQPLEARRKLLRQRVLSKLADPIRESPELEASLPDLIQSVKAQGLEGLVTKRRDSRYESGQRSGAWQKMRVNQGQEFVIGGYTVGGKALRRPGVRLLRGRPAHLRRTHPQRLHACIAICPVPALQRPGDGPVPLRQPA